MVLQKACFVELGRDEKRRLQSTDKNAVKAAIFFWSTPEVDIFSEFKFYYFLPNNWSWKVPSTSTAALFLVDVNLTALFYLVGGQWLSTLLTLSTSIFHQALKLTILHLNNINFCIWRDKLHVQKIKKNNIIRKISWNLIWFQDIYRQSPVKSPDIKTFK